MYTKNELAAHFFNLFKKYGFKEITVDDLANDCGMSKKTLYQHFQNKEEIVEEVVNYFIKSVEEIIESSSGAYTDVISKLVNVYSNLVNYLVDINPIFFGSLKKYHKNVFPKLVEATANNFRRFTKNIIEEGINENVFSKQLDLEYLRFSQESLFLLYLRENWIIAKYPEFNAKRFVRLLLNNIRGITTVEGHIQLDEKQYIAENILSF